LGAAAEPPQDIALTASKAPTIDFNRIPITASRDLSSSIRSLMSNFRQEFARRAM